MHTHTPHAHRRAALRPMRSGKLHPLHPAYGTSVVRLGSVRLRNPLGLVVKLAIIIAAIAFLIYAIAYAPDAAAHDAPPPCHETPCEGERS